MQGPLFAALSVLSALFGWGGGADDCGHAGRQGAAAARQIEAEWPVRGAEDPVTGYIQRLGRQLARAAHIPGAGRSRFHVVRNLTPTAFALGGGQYVVSDGLVALVRNESELAAVLAHEISHERAGHFCRRSPRDAERYRIGSLVQHYDIDAEKEADATAVGVLREAGFDPRAMESVLRCIADRGSEVIGDLLWSRIVSLAASEPSATGAAFVDSYAFVEARDRVRADLERIGGGLDGCR